MSDGAPRMRYIVCWSQDDPFVALLKHCDDGSAAGSLREPEGLTGWSESDQRDWYASHNVVWTDAI